MRLLGLALVVFLGAAMVWGATDLPQRGDPLAPAAVHEFVAVYYIERAYEQTRTPNMVTAVLVDYRGFDTLGEAMVVLVAALACLLILPRRRSPDEAMAKGKTSMDAPAGGNS
jgi:multicomponent Na+:H+ antiporter subunit B